MSSSLDKLQDLPVEIVCLSVTPPVIRRGRVTCHEEGPCDVMLNEPEPRLETGMRVVLDGGPDSDLRIKGLVAEMEGCRLRVEPQRMVPTDKRSFPRMYGGIHVRYRVLASGQEETVRAAWTAGNEAAATEGDWWEPDPFMDFSGTGLRFEDQLRCKVNDLLLMELGVPSRPDRWRATAQVVRVDPIRTEEGEGRDEAEQMLEPTHQIAVQFADLPKEAAEALTEFGMRIQDALLKT